MPTEVGEEKTLEARLLTMELYASATMAAVSDMAFTLNRIIRGEPAHPDAEASMVIVSTTMSAWHQHLSAEVLAREKNKEAYELVKQAGHVN